MLELVNTWVYHPNVKTFFWMDEFYNKHKQEILEWARDNRCVVESSKYGWVVCPDDETVMLFRLRWTE